MAGVDLLQESASSFPPPPAPESQTTAAPPSISLPKGGGAIRGIGEKFSANPVTGTASFSVPIATSPGRSGFGPQLTLAYDSGAGNGPFGFGWHLSLPSITRKTDKGLPRYDDTDESDVFILSGTEDLVPVLEQKDGAWRRQRHERKLNGVKYQVARYRPRVEGLFARIERWTNVSSGEAHWRSISRDNVTTWYGQTAESRISDPANPLRTFSWLICESRDDKGNAILYDYQAEDSDGVDSVLAHERSRDTASRSANRYIKRIKYSNRVSHLIEEDVAAGGWLFEVVFDYGEHDEPVPTPADSGSWICRRDPFSSYRAAFEVRTYRLCQRVLMFHHFPDEPGVGQSCLVRSTDFSYAESSLDPPDAQAGDAVLTFLTSVTGSGYRRLDDGGYLKRSLPPLEFSYSQPVVDPTVRELDRDSLEDLPDGLNRGYRWVDLNGEGIAGVLSEQATAWFYKPNLGSGYFGPVEVVTPQPSLAALTRGRQQLMDLSGDGQLDLVALGGTGPGYYEHTSPRRWENFRPFAELPQLRWDDPNLRFVDLDGDGLADVLITEDDALTWYPSLGSDGFAAGQRVFEPLDEREGPRLVFADPEQSVYLADMTGDGLSDLARVRAGEVCYWPNLGYGHFGARVTMDNPPWLDAPDLFDQRRVRLADIDGSGTGDLIYLGAHGVELYFNQSGNRFSAPHRLPSFPAIDNIADVQAIDLLGNGTACLVWSSPLAGDATRPLRYLELMAAGKPHLLTAMANNLGAETHLRYTPSTTFYLADKAAGTPWMTRLPFPVQCVERVEVFDRISRNRFVTRYSYHHGYFDGVEREFRGFGRVDQLDTEQFAALSLSDHFPTGDNIDAPSHVPPVLTKTWFHTGVFAGAGRISRHLEHEYWQEPGLDDDEREAMRLPDSALPAGLSFEELREAHRALKGSMLRQEVYGLDGSEAVGRPYTASERNYTIRQLQPLGGNRYAVFYTHAREVLDSSYERKLYEIDGRRLADPRVAHALTLAIDEFGNVLDSVTIAYSRKRTGLEPGLADPEITEQGRSLAVLTQNRYTEPVRLLDAFRASLQSESRIFELLLPQFEGDGQLFPFEDLQHMNSEAGGWGPVLPFEDIDQAQSHQSRPCRRILDRSITLYRADDLSRQLPLGTLEPLALPFETYRLAFTRALSEKVFGSRVTEKTFADAAYVHVLGDQDWWLPSGQIFFSPSTNDSPNVEFQYARSHFFLPLRYRDAFQQTTSVEHDKVDLLIQATRDALGNTVSAGERDASGVLVTNGNDYRVLQPRVVMDANRNRAEASFDALGMVVGTAVSGKPEERLGDSLRGFEPDLTEQMLLQHMTNPLAEPAAILLEATSRLVYDLHAYRRTRNSQQPDPPAIYTLLRETHAGDLAPGECTRVQHRFLYCDGFGHQLQQKSQAQAERGPVRESEPAERWTASGWTVFNNKGKPVRKYEPFFGATQAFEFAVKSGVSSILCYDPLERVVASIHPNHSFEKTVFDGWRQENWDVNDTALQSNPAEDPDVGDFFRRLPAFEYLPTWYEQRAGGEKGRLEQQAASKTAPHAGTPARQYFDPLGRVILSVAHNRFKRAEAYVDEMYPMAVRLDIQGNQREVRDALGRSVVRYDYNLLARRIHESSVDAGERWLFGDVLGMPNQAWDSRGNHLAHLHDELHRATHLFLSKDGASPVLVERVVYGEQCLNPEAQNLRGRGFLQLDQSGLVMNAGSNSAGQWQSYDFKGNLLTAIRLLAQDYRGPVDWIGLDSVLAGSSLDPTTVPPACLPMLEDGTFQTSTIYDALNRPTQATTPDRSVVSPTYNIASQLDRIDVRHRGASTSTPIVTSIDYNARGDRLRIRYANHTSTRYEYDPESFRLIRLHTARSGFPSEAVDLQDVGYTYDPVGNITHLLDDAGIQGSVFFRNQRVDASSDFDYDAIYRLTEATGREHLGQAEGKSGGIRPTDAFDRSRIGLSQPNDAAAMATYHESYAYDPAGNILKLIHDVAGWRWTRTYEYAERDGFPPTNRLLRTICGGITEHYAYDANGNMTSMAHLPRLEWDFKNQLHMSQMQAGEEAERTFYVYQSNGSRVRKVVEHSKGSKSQERLYLGQLEIFRSFDGPSTDVAVERQTLHVADDQHRVVMFETRTTGNDPGPGELMRFQYANHLGSSVLELDLTANVISYEEYFPYGSTSYQAVRSVTETPKRYRFTGKERDEETGLYCHNARYYASWLGRWTSCDPSGIKGGLNLYAYVEARPTIAADPSGHVFWFFVAAVVVVATLTSVSESGAPTNEADARAVKPHISDEEFMAHTAVTGVSMAVGNETGAAMKGAPAMLKGMSGGLTGGVVQGVGDQAIQDVKKGDVSSPEQYANVAVKSGATGVVIGGTAAVCGQVVKAGFSTIRPGGSPDVNMSSSADVATDSTTDVPTDVSNPKSGEQLDLPGIPSGNTGTTDVPSSVDSSTATPKTWGDGPPPPELDVGEVKPVASEEGGWSQLRQPTRSTQAAIGPAAEGGGRQAVAVYNRETGEVILKVREIGGMEEIVWQGKIGQFSEAELAEMAQASGGDPAKFGNLAEAPVCQMVGDATGQDFLSKDPSANGPDLLPSQLPLPGVR
jgi:RHS repeat-associated protein